MKKVRNVIYSLLSVILFFSMVLTPMSTEAGSTEHTIDKSMLDNANWSNPEEDVVIEEGTIVFSKDSTEYSRYISKQVIKKDTLFDNLATLSANVKFETLPAGKSFMIVFGLEGVEACAGEAKNVEVTFTNANGIRVGVNAYDEDGTLHTVAKPVACGISLNRAAQVSVTITTKGNISVSVDGRSVCTGEIPVTAEGRVGFLQSGACAVTIADLEIKHYEYARPENTNIVEDFEKGGMNVAVLTARALSMYSIWPRGQYVADDNGNKVLRHLNVSDTYVGTLHQYSNFEISFDVPYVNTISEFNDIGEFTRVGQQQLMISMGNEQADWDSEGWQVAQETVVYDDGAVYSFNHPNDIRANLKKNPFAGEGRAFSVKLSVVDAVVTAQIKWLEEKTYDTVLTYKLSGGTPLGYVQVWVPEYGDCSIDNLKITNLDKNPNLIDVEYQSGEWKKPEDFKYTKMERVYADKDAQTKAPSLTASVYWLVPIIATVIGIGALLITGGIIRKKRMQKEETVHEN